MSVLSVLLTYTLVILIISYALGLIWGGPAKANWILSWELKKLRKFGLWILKHVFQLLANFFQYLAKSCGPKQKKKTP